VEDAFIDIENTGIGRPESNLITLSFAVKKARVANQFLNVFYGKFSEYGISFDPGPISQQVKSISTDNGLQNYITYYVELQIKSVDLSVYTVND